MATRSHPKNYPRDSQPKKNQQNDPILPGPAKPHPGYPGTGPPPPGKAYMGVTQRTPSGTEKYYPEWKSSNLKSNQLAENERLAAERLLEETKDLITETRLKLKNDTKEVIEIFDIASIFDPPGSTDGRIGGLSRKVSVRPYTKNKLRL